MDEDIFQHLTMIVAVVLGCAFLLAKTLRFRELILKTQLSAGEKFAFAVFGGIAGILGTHTGFPTEHTIVNARSVVVIISGLIGGPWVGFGAGAIAGIERYFHGGFTVLASSGATVLQGTLAGFYYTRFNALHVRWPAALAIGFLLESLHMLLMLVFSQSYDQAWEIVQDVSPAMLLINPLGLALLIAILDGIYEEKEKVEGKAAQLALQIAGRTVDYLRKGLTEETANKTAATIFQHAGTLDAVFITSTDQVLAFVGIGADHHAGTIKTQSTMCVLAKGNYILAKNRAEIGCEELACLLQSQIVVPLTDRGTIIGSLGFCKTKPDSITPFEIELIQGLSQLISTQVEVSKVDQLSTLRTAAEIKALQAQINPHFLFNAINTIVYYCRSNPETARGLLLNLADYYRNNLLPAGEWVDLPTEINHIDSYVKIEAARFQGKLNVSYDFTEPYYKKIPALILQPIVENAIKHGLYPKKTGGSIRVSGRIVSGKYIITVEDDGVGIAAEQLPELLVKQQNCSETLARIGLHNVHDRLQTIYGSEYGLTIQSNLGQGTSVLLAFPE